MNATHSEKRKNTEGVKRGQQSNEIKMAINVITKCTKKSCLPTSSGERLIRGYTKFDFTVDEGKEWLDPSREKNEGKHRRRKVGKSCVTFLLCDPGW